MDVHNTVGIDLVAMVVNDLIVTGAEPLFFLDYLSVGRVIPKKVALIVEGIADGCRQAGCVLLGGETAEHPGLMSDDDYDLAGFAVGIVEKSEIIDGGNLTSGDVIIGIASSGLHSNGFSLVRRVFGVEDKEKLNQDISKLGTKLGEELLRPTRIYVDAVLKLKKMGLARGIAHITGGGLTDNIIRILPENLDARIDTSSWGLPPIFELIQQRSGIEDEEMRRIFNMGIGMTVMVADADVDQAIGKLEESGEKAFVCGKLEGGSGRVRYG